jgi:hypothetical protein
MRDQGTGSARATKLAPREFERVALEALLDNDNQRPWTVAELVLELGDPVATLDAVADLHRAGLAHRREDLIWPTRSAVAYHELVD